MPLTKARMNHSLYVKAKELGFSELSIRQVVELYTEEFLRMPSTIGDILEILE